MALELPREVRMIGQNFFPLGYELNGDGTVKHVKYGYRGKYLEPGSVGDYIFYRSLNPELIRKILEPLRERRYEVLEQETITGFKVSKGKREFTVSRNLEHVDTILIEPVKRVTLKKIKPFLKDLEASMINHKE